MSLRRIIFPVLLMLTAWLLEISLIPTLLPAGLRPGLVLVVSAVWASLRNTEGLLWAAGGGLLLDLASAGPFGANMAGLVLGNVLAMGFDRIPVPSRLFRATNWVAVVTLVFHAVLIAGLGFTGMNLDGTFVEFALGSRVLPLMLINPLLSLVVFVLARPVHDWLARQRAFVR